MEWNLPLNNYFIRTGFLHNSSFVLCIMDLLQQHDKVLVFLVFFSPEIEDRIKWTLEYYTWVCSQQQCCTRILHQNPFSITNHTHSNICASQLALDSSCGSWKTISWQVVFFTLIERLIKSVILVCWLNKHTVFTDHETDALPLMFPMGFICSMITFGFLQASLCRIWQHFG